MSKHKHFHLSCYDGFFHVMVGPFGTEADVLRHIDELSQLNSNYPTMEFEVRSDLNADSADAKKTRALVKLARKDKTYLSPKEDREFAIRYQESW